VFEQAAAGIALSAPDGTWLDVNEKMCAITGYRRDELVHRNAMEFTHPEDRRSNLAQRRALLAGECQTVTYEKRFVRPDGGVVWTILAVSLLRGANGAPERFLVVADDISERRRAEIELRRLAMHLEARVHEEVAARQAAQARAAHAERMQTLGQLAGGIAHDFNNVLQALEGAATLIERKAADPASVRRLALLAQEAVGRGASITRRLLAFGRRADLRAEALDVAELLDGLREILAHTLGAAIDVCVSLADDLPPVFADKAQLETALVNLATNARDAMPTGGRLTFAADHETVVHADKAGLAPGRYIRFTVTDTGHGMDAATLARVGEPFFTTKEVGAGTGLGLPMARGFAEQSGGALSIDSSPGTGTTVTLWLPQAAAHAGGGIRRSQRSATGTTTSIRVLLVDDEELVRDTLAEHLLSSGCGVVAARSGSEALALLESGEQVDVLVTDLSMPEIDGVAVIQAVRQILPGLPVVLLTGYAGDGTALAMSGPLSGAFSLLRKPVRPEQLLDRINVLLAAQQQPAG
jgi:PAS domain S-box-containing protein